MEKRRVLSYDVFRGVLLIGMVIFHVLVNLTFLNFNQEFFYWVPLGFVMFLGVVLGRFLQLKGRKKAVLGAKLLGLFLVLNVGTFVGDGFSWSGFLLGDQVNFSFEILFPMSVLIFFSVVLDRVVGLWKWLLALVFLGLVVLNVVDFYSYNVMFLIYGVVGYFLGAGVDLDAMAKRLVHPMLVVLFLVIAFVPLIFIGMGQLYDFVLIGQVLALYFVATAIFKEAGWLVWLGKNSLWLYVGHIFLIKLITLI